MPDFMFAYHGGKRAGDPEEDAEIMAKWKAWIGDLGDAVVDPGKPFGRSRTVNSGGIFKNGARLNLSGFSVVNADSMDAALELAKGCPHIEHGTVEVVQMVEM